jgi:hypothetical protein
MPARQASARGAELPMQVRDRPQGCLVALCPRCQRQTDAAYVQGRLTITPLGQGQFRRKVVQETDKWLTRATQTADDRPTG